MQIRSFLALNFSVSVTRRIAEEVERHKAALATAGQRISWVPAANLHLTLQFLGAIDEELVEGIAGRVGAVATRHRPFELKAVGFGRFPLASTSEPARVLWVGVRDSAPLLALQKDVVGALVGLGLSLPSEPSGFHPHVTVGRVKEAAAAGLAWSSEAELGASLVNEIVVYESRSDTAGLHGVEYQARARIPIGPVAAAPVAQRRVS